MSVRDRSLCERSRGEGAVNSPKAAGKDKDFPNSVTFFHIFLCVCTWSHTPALGGRY